MPGFLMTSGDFRRPPSPWTSNLVEQSENLGNAAFWTTTNATITADATTAPNGTLTADKLVEAATSTTHLIQQTPITIVSGETYTGSVFVKAAERDTCFINVANVVSSSGVFASLDLTNEVLSSLGSFGTGTYIAASLKNFGSGWIRVRVTGIIAADTSIRIAVFLSNPLDTSNYVGDGTSGLFVWGFQLELGNVATPYRAN